MRLRRRGIDGSSPGERLVLGVALAELPGDLGARQLDPKIEGMCPVSLDAETALLQKAQAAQDKIQNGPDPLTIRTAQLDVSSAQIAADKANADLNALVRGPDQIVIDQAQRDVDLVLKGRRI